MLTQSSNPSIDSIIFLLYLFNSHPLQIIRGFEITTSDKQQQSPKFTRQ